MRIAVATSDGKKVDQHFGKAIRFDVYDVDGEKMKLVESRDVTSYCDCVDGEPVDPNHKFAPDRFSAVKETIQDCDKLYTVQIGEKPKEQLQIVGIDVQTCSCNIDQIPTCKGNCK